MPRLDVAVLTLRSAMTTVGGWMARLRTDAALRERTLSHAAFAAIFAFGVVAIDRIITGGADWQFGPDQAYAMAPSPSPVFMPVEHRASPPAVADEEPAAEAIVEVDYSFTTEVLLGGPLPENDAAKHASDSANIDSEAGSVTAIKK
ncbi:MAG: hypothetical protein K2P58_14065 [Hyphomonadaceae bacterium]|nr:hypothetical protein [Hyphomonadaceae bacterium]